MQFTFADALRQLGPNASFRLINGARVPGNYMFASILPERNIPDYKVEAGSMTIRPLMAGLVAMDSPYPETSAMEVSTFLAQSAKIANRATFPEATLRRLHMMVQQLQMAGQDTSRAVVQNVLNFQGALLNQPHFDTAEWLRGQALLGGIDWTFNGKRLLIDYGIPAANKPAQRTGNNGYGGSTSQFWADNQLALKLLRYDRRAVIMHPDTFNMIIANPANNIQVVAQAGDASMGTYQLVKMVAQNSVNMPSPDFRDRTTVVTYGLEGEMLNPDGTTTKIPFIKPGKVLHLGNNTPSGYTVGAGSQARNEYELGYYHIAPTVESGGLMGRWSRIYTPEGEPWSLRGQAVENSLPVVEAPEKIVVFDSVMV